MNRNNHWIGFDRRIEASWMDFAALQVAKGATGPEVREALLGFLQSLSYDPNEAGSARPKTIRVILRMWGSPAPERASLHKKCSELIDGAEPQDLAGLNWTMAVAVYPYFFDHAEILGRMLALQETASARQVLSRITPVWGDRETVRRTSRYVLRTMVAWGALENVGKGVYGLPERKRIGAVVGGQLIKGLLFNSTGKAAGLKEILSHPAAFPFEHDVGIDDLRGLSGVELAQEGAGRLVVRLG